MIPRTATPILSGALYVLANEIESPDGVANAAIFEAAERLRELHALVALFWPMVQAQNGAEHMLDGFGPRRPAPSDEVFERVRAEVGA